MEWMSDYAYVFSSVLLGKFPSESLLGRSVATTVVHCLPFAHARGRDSSPQGIRPVSWRALFITNLRAKRCTYIYGGLFWEFQGPTVYSLCMNINILGISHWWAHKCCMKLSMKHWHIHDLLCAILVYACTMLHFQHIYYHIICISQSVLTSIGWCVHTYIHTPFLQTDGSCEFSQILIISWQSYCK